MKKTLAFAMLALCIFMLFSCASPEEKILGTWVGSENSAGISFDVEMTFNEDGTGKTEAMGISVDFSYTIDSKTDTLTITLSAFGFDVAEEEYLFEFDGDTLTLTGSNSEYTLTKKD